MDVLYSLFDVDKQRLDILLQENIFTNTLNFVLTTLTDDILSLANPIINQFCMNILPKIHYNVKSLTVDSIYMERILLTGNYPNLTELKLFNFNDKFVSHYFTVESSFRHVFQRQITDLILVFKDDFNDITIKQHTTDIYGYILKFFENLKHLSIIRSFPYYYLPLKYRNRPLTTFFSSTLSKLSIHVLYYDDFLALVDGHFKQLTTLIVVITDMKYDSSNVYNMDNLRNLKCFSLQCYSISDQYDIQILPLFHYVLNLEELTLYLTIDRRTTFIDGNHIYNEILIHMPQLHTFNFCFCTDIRINPLVNHLSKDDIQQTFTNIKCQQQMECIVNYLNLTGTCHIFSLPFMFDYLECIGNTFPSIIFNHVRRLWIHDEIPFNHEFFIRIACSFPLLKELYVMNDEPQSSILDTLNSNDNQLSSTIIEYPYLISLDISNCHIDYIEEFLNNTKIRLPHLMKLTVNYDQLIIVTENFTRDVTRLNCTKVKKEQINMDRFLYIKLIEQQLKPYIDTLYDDVDVIWQDDSDSKHRSQYALNKINEIFNERVEPEEQAAKMTDIWSIENIWGYIK
ncbi:unnamed protein product [Rotaria sp. Silwood2]|nr:unnamed protein product [Rotaria sp. Silwood2]CAF4222411.1 unnamed protein product [Rotaria sp. Silwood2]